MTITVAVVHNALTTAARYDLDVIGARWENLLSGLVERRRALGAGPSQDPSEELSEELSDDPPDEAEPDLPASSVLSRPGP